MNPTSKELLAGHGCTDHNCVIDPPKRGHMGTNGGCHCLDNIQPTMRRVRVRSVLYRVQKLEAFVERMRVLCTEGHTDATDLRGDILVELDAL
jgi:hypothetical protein